jgi:hypothetical protein
VKKRIHKQNTKFLIESFLRLLGHEKAVEQKIAAYKKKRRKRGLEELEWELLEIQLEVSQSILHFRHTEQKVPELPSTIEQFVDVMNKSIVNQDWYQSCYQQSPWANMEPPKTTHLPNEPRGITMVGT